MTKEEYEEALKSPQWLDKRDRIKKRDGYKCVKCNSKEKLHVHHTYYLIDRMPWQVPDDCLMTLCNICHKKEHAGRPISSFYRKKPPKNTNKKSTTRNKNNLSKKDFELQKKYNAIKKKGKLPKTKTIKPKQKKRK